MRDGALLLVRETGPSGDESGYGRRVMEDQQPGKLFAATVVVSLALTAASLLALVALVVVALLR